VHVADGEHHAAALLELVAGYAPEYLVLAKYMRVLSPGFVARFPRRIINIHHSFLPAFVGASPYRQAFQRVSRSYIGVVRLLSSLIVALPLRVL